MQFLMLVTAETNKRIKDACLKQRQPPLDILKRPFLTLPVVYFQI